MILPSIHGFARFLAVFALVLTAVAALTATQPAAPPPPREYKVVLRYHIGSADQIRVARFREMVAFLESLGFKKEEGPENEVSDPDQTRMTGSIGAPRARQLLRERHVQSILLIPSDFDLAAEGDKPVKVQLELTGGLPLERQRLLREQVIAQLQKVGFQEAIGYDNRRHTRIVGTLPASSVEQLLEDLRWQSSGWLAPQTPVVELPLPIRNSWPVRVVEILPEPSGVAPAKTPPPAAPLPEGEESSLKIAPDLRALTSKKDLVRMEVVLIAEPAALDFSWRRDLLQAAPGTQLEGRLGPVVTVKALPDQAADYAHLASVSAVRLPRFGSAQPAPRPTDASNSEALKLSGLERLHAAGHRGKGIRIAIIDDDFSGYQQLKQLAGKTTYVDLSAECDPDVRARIVPSDVSAVGHGSQCALAAALAAPEAQLTLVRIDADAPFQLLEAARYIRGDPVFSVSLDERRAELSNDAVRLERARDQLVEERRALVEEFGDDEATRKKREAWRAKETALDKEEKELHERDLRFLNLNRALRNLKGIQIVACGLIWNEGYPVDGSSVLSRFFDEAGLQPATWFQSIGNTQGQVWSGLFRDVDGNGVMEFAPPDAPLKPERWTAELNFLGWQPLSAAASRDLPRTKLRITMQWREPHDPTFQRQGRDVYLMPLADLRLLVLRQRDPSGSKLPTDDLELIGRDAGVPQRIDNEPSSATYELAVEFAADTPGRYALRVEGRIPKSVRPANEPTLPGQEVAWELRPRIFVSLVDQNARGSGRPIFWDYATEVGNPGMPADALGVVSVGAADFAGKPRPYTALGPTAGAELRRKPDLFSFDGPDLPAAGGNFSAGTNVANAFSAGLAASVFSVKGDRATFLRDLKAQPGAVLRVP